MTLAFYLLHSFIFESWKKANLVAFWASNVFFFFFVATFKNQTQLVWSAAFMQSHLACKSYYFGAFHESCESFFLHGRLKEQSTIFFKLKLGTEVWNELSQKGFKGYTHPAALINKCLQDKKFYGHRRWRLSCLTITTKSMFRGMNESQTFKLKNTIQSGGNSFPLSCCLAAGGVGSLHSGSLLFLQCYCRNLTKAGTYHENSSAAFLLTSWIKGGAILTAPLLVSEWISEWLQK